MILVTVLAAVAVIHVVLLVVSRGNLEHAVLRLPLGRKAYLASLQAMADAGAEAENLNVYEVMRHARLRFWAAFPARLLLAVAAGLALAAIPAVPAWVGAILPALQIGFQAALDRAVLEQTGNLPLSPEPTVVQRVVRWATWWLSAAVAWLALWLAYSPVSSVRALAGEAAERASDLVLCLTGAAGVLLLLGLAGLVARLGGRLSQRFASPQFEMYAGPETILYLRSFGDDDRRIQTPVSESSLRSLIWPSLPFEEFLSYCTGMGKGKGTLVTIGRPGEWLPRAGAVRGYYREDQWREGIRLTAERAGKVILTAGSTESLSWEITHLREWGLLGKCLFVVPPLDEAETALRLGRLLDALQVSADEQKKFESMPLRTIVGLRIRDDGTVSWLVAPGRDWMAYLMAVSFHHVRTGRVLADPLAAAREDYQSAAGRRPRGTTRPLRPPKAVTQVMRRTLGAWASYQRDRNDHAFDAYSAALRRCRAEPAADLQAVAYLMSMATFSAMDADRADEALTLVYDLADLAESLDWVWVRPGEVMGRDELLYELWGLAADIEEGRGDRGNRVAALRQRWAAAVRERDRRHQCEAACDLAVVVNPKEARALAEVALDHANHLADPELQGQAHGILAFALEAIGETGWQEHGLASAQAYEQSGEQDMAARAWRFLSLASRDAGDEAGARAELERGLGLVTADGDLRSSMQKALAELDLTQRAIGMLSPTAAEVWQETRRISGELGTIAAAAVLAAVLRRGDADAMELLVRHGHDPTAISEQLAARLAQYGHAAAPATLPLTHMARNVLLHAVRAADARRASAVQVRDLMAGLLEVDRGDVAELLHPDRFASSAPPDQSQAEATDQPDRGPERPLLPTGRSEGGLGEVARARCGGALLSLEDFDDDDTDPDTALAMSPPPPPAPASLRRAFRWTARLDARLLKTPVLLWGQARERTVAKLGRLQAQLSARSGPHAREETATILCLVAVIRSETVEEGELHGGAAPRFLDAASAFVAHVDSDPTGWVWADLDEAVPGTVAAFHLLRAAANTLVLLDDLPAAAAALRRRLAIAQGGLGPKCQAAALCDLADILADTDPRSALDHAAAALNLWSEAGATKGPVHAAWVTAHALLEQGSPDGLAASRQAAAQARAGGGDRLAAKLLGAAADCADQHGDHESAQDLYREALAVAPAQARDLIDVLKDRLRGAVTRSQ